MTIFRSIGLMSGTSMDGIDAVILETDGQSYVKTLAQASISYPSTFIHDLKAVEQKLANLPLNKFPNLNEVAQQSTLYHQQAINQLVATSPYTIDDVDIIAYHGQTLCHRPNEKFTLQIGCAQQIANYFNKLVITQFRQNDINHGGQGAPLAPLYHQTLIQNKGITSAAIINCGGIANLTVITDQKIIAGFDTGPGNVLLDRLVRYITDGQENYDQDGRYALQGNIDQDLLTILWQTSCRIANYYQLPPPKSLDSQDLAFDLENYFNKAKRSLNDGCATLATFTALTIAQSIELLKKPHPNYWIIAGGGAKHPMIKQQLINYLKPKIPKLILQTAEEAGFCSTYLEAELIGWLAVRSIKNLPLTLPETTGVDRPRSGGQLVLPRK